jgi:hypothetical protein
VTAPHALHVCVLKRHTIPEVWAELARLAERRTVSFDRRPPGDTRGSAAAASVGQSFQGSRGSIRTSE